jgi:hypothetical protein
VSALFQIEQLGFLPTVRRESRLKVLCNTPKCCWQEFIIGRVAIAICAIQNWRSQIMGEWANVVPGKSNIPSPNQRVEPTI